MMIQPIRCQIFQPHQSLVEYIQRFVPSLQEEDVLVVTSKIVALSQGRIVDDVHRKEEIVREESDVALNTHWCFLTLKDGHWGADAGVDQSNADDRLILWPSHPFDVASMLHSVLRRTFNIKDLGILITDSRVFPLRAGVTGVGIAYAGFQGLRDYRGNTDLFGRTLTMTQTNVVDTLASAAVLVMGEGAECTPLAVIQDAPIVFTDEVDETALSIDPEQCLYHPLFQQLDREG